MRCLIIAGVQIQNMKLADMTIETKSLLLSLQAFKQSLQSNYSGQVTTGKVTEFFSKLEEAFTSFNDDSQNPRPRGVPVM